MSGIKYYQLADGEELPDEFCAIRNTGGEPTEYTFYRPEAENTRVRELCARMARAMDIDNRDPWADPEWCPSRCADTFGCRGSDAGEVRCPIVMTMRELGIEVGG